VNFCLGEAGKDGTDRATDHRSGSVLHSDPWCVEGCVGHGMRIRNVGILGST